LQPDFTSYHNHEIPVRGENYGIYGKPDSPQKQEQLRLLFERKPELSIDPETGEFCRQMQRQQVRLDGDEDDVMADGTYPR
jgi:hypothetical protein